MRDPHRRLAGSQQHQPLPYHEGCCDNEACEGHLAVIEPEYNLSHANMIRGHQDLQQVGTWLMERDVRTQVDPLRQELPDVHV